MLNATYITMGATYKSSIPSIIEEIVLLLHHLDKAALIIDLSLKLTSNVARVVILDTFQLNTQTSQLVTFADKESLISTTTAQQRVNEVICLEVGEDDDDKSDCSNDDDQPCIVGHRLFTTR